MEADGYDGPSSTLDDTILRTNSSVNNIPEKRIQTRASTRMNKPTQQAMEDQIAEVPKPKKKEVTAMGDDFVVGIIPAEAPTSGPSHGRAAAARKSRQQKPSQQQDMDFVPPVLLDMKDDAAKHGLPVSWRNRLRNRANTPAPETFRNPMDITDACSTSSETETLSPNPDKKKPNVEKKTAGRNRARTPAPKMPSPQRTVDMSEVLSATHESFQHKTDPQKDTNPKVETKLVGRTRVNSSAPEKPSRKKMVIPDTVPVRNETRPSMPDGQETIAVDTGPMAEESLPAKRKPRKKGSSKVPAPTQRLMDTIQRVVANNSFPETNPAPFAPFIPNNAPKAEKKVRAKRTPKTTLSDVEIAARDQRYMETIERVVANRCTPDPETSPDPASTTKKRMSIALEARATSPDITAFHSKKSRKDASSRPVETPSLKTDLSDGASASQLRDSSNAFASISSTSKPMIMMPKSAVIREQPTSTATKSSATVDTEAIMTPAEEPASPEYPAPEPPTSTTTEFSATAKAMMPCAEQPSQSSATPDQSASTSVAGTSATIGGRFRGLVNQAFQKVVGQKQQTMATMDFSNIENEAVIPRAAETSKRPALSERPASTNAGSSVAAGSSNAAGPSTVSTRSSTAARRSAAGRDDATGSSSSTGPLNDAAGPSSTTGCAVVGPSSTTGRAVAGPSSTTGSAVAGPSSTAGYAYAGPSSAANVDMQYPVVVEPILTAYSSSSSSSSSSSTASNSSSGSSSTSSSRSRSRSRSGSSSSSSSSGSETDEIPDQLP